MLDSSPEMTISETSQSCLYITCTVFTLIFNSSSRQSSWSLFGALDLIISLPECFLSYFCSCLTALDNGMNGSVCLKWHHVILSSFLNSPWIISLALACIIAGCTQSHWKRRNNASWASLFSFIWNKHDQPQSAANICAHSLTLLVTVLSHNMW